MYSYSHNHWKLILADDIIVITLSTFHYVNSPYLLGASRWDVGVGRNLHAVERHRHFTSCRQRCSRTRSEVQDRLLNTDCYQHRRGANTSSQLRRPTFSMRKLNWVSYLSYDSYLNFRNSAFYALVPKCCIVQLWLWEGCYFDFVLKMNSSICNFFYRQFTPSKPIGH